LRELHAFDGSTQRVGRVQNHAEFALRSALAALPFAGAATSLGPAAKPARSISRPLDRTLDELLILARFDGTDPRIGGLQVELFAWLGREDPYVIARERSVLELGAAGRRLGLERPVQRAEGAEAAGPEDVQDAVRALWAAVERGARPEVDAALAVLGALDVDLDGSRRTLAALNLVLERSLDGEVATRVLAAQLDAQKQTCALALGDALMDADGAVRAAAIAGGASWSESARDELLRAWGSVAQDSFDADPAVLRTVASLLAQGVPAGDDLEPWLDRLYVIAESPDGPASIAACRALGELMEGSTPSLRPEEWLVRLIEADRAAGAAGETAP